MELMTGRPRKGKQQEWCMSSTADPHKILQYAARSNFSGMTMPDQTITWSNTGYLCNRAGPDYGMPSRCRPRNLIEYAEPLSLAGMVGPHEDSAWSNTARIYRQTEREWSTSNEQYPHEAIQHAERTERDYGGMRDQTRTLSNADYRPTPAMPPPNENTQLALRDEVGISRLPEQMTTWPDLGRPGVSTSTQESEGLLRAPYQPAAVHRSVEAESLRQNGPLTQQPELRGRVSDYRQMRSPATEILAPAYYVGLQSSTCLQGFGWVGERY